MYAIAFPAIDPIALELGPLVIRWYSLAYVMGILLGWQYGMRLADRTDGRIERGHVDDFILWATLGVILGGRLGYVLFYKPDYFLANPLEILAMWNGGMSFHGGTIGVFLAIWWYSWRHNLAFLAFADVITAVVPIGLFFGRLANFVNGELFGRASDVPWAMVFPRGGPAPRHPSQLYEAGLEGLVLFGVITLIIFGYQGLKRPGLVTGTFLAGYAIARFMVEYMREPDAHLGTLYGIATMGQILSLPLAAFGFWLIVRAVRRS